MRINSSTHAAQGVVRNNPATSQSSSRAAEDDGGLRKAFDSFVGEVLFGQMLKAMRKTVGKPAYFHGGRAEELFQQQLDQVLAEEMSEVTGEQLSEPMFELLRLTRK